MGFLDAEKVLADLRSSQFVLTDKIYFIRFTHEKSSQNDLAELKARCSRLGYSFNNVERDYLSDSEIKLFFLVRNVPSYFQQPFEVFEETTLAI